MWTFDFTIPTLAVLTVLFVFYVTRPVLPIRRNRGFFTLLITTMVTIVLDIFATLADNEYTSFPIWLSYLLNILYFMAFFTRIFAFFQYTRVLVTKNPRKPLWYLTFQSIFYVLLEIFVVITPLTKLIFSIDEKGYHAGDYYYLIYLFSYFFIAVSLLAVFVYHRNISKRSFWIAITYNLVLAGGLLHRWLMPKAVVFNLYCVLALLIIYLSFQDHYSVLSSKTKCFNENAVFDYLKEIDINKRSLYLLGISIPNFQKYSQIYGHEQIDKMLMDQGTFLRKNFHRNRFSWFYLGNAHFLLASKKPMQFTEIKDTLITHFFDGNRNMTLPLSFFVFSAGENHLNPEYFYSSLLCAFEKLNDYPNHASLVINNEMQQQVVIERHTKDMLDKAIAENKVEPYLQLVYSTKDHAFVGGEILARIKDENGKLLMPSLFIPMAERSGQIIQIGEQMFSKACDFLNTPQGRKLKFVNVNLSPIQCLSDEPFERLLQIAFEKNIDPKRVMLEITEDALINDAVLSERLKRIHGNGFSFSLDDFGKGESNITRLGIYPFEEIKLDMEFVRQYCSNPEHNILPYLVKNLKKFGYKVVAEGVEDKKMVMMMTALGVDYLQGYFFSKPFPLSQFEDNFRLPDIITNQIEPKSE